MNQYRILCFGDSVVMGTWDTQGGWVDRLKQYFQTEYFARKRKVQVFNLGIGGEFSSGLAKRMQSEIEARLNSKWEPIIIIGTGKNDVRAHGTPNNYDSTPEKYEQDLRNCIKIAQKYSPKILLIGLGLVDESVQFKDLYYENTRMKLFNEVNKRVAQECEVFRVELQDDMEKLPDLSSWFVDGIHPNYAGYQWIYEKIKPGVLKLLET
jgi:lysophospholipase L1-like esterase